MELFLHNLSTHKTISKKGALDKVKDLIELLRGQHTRHSHAKHKDEALTSINKPHEVLELPSQDDNAFKDPRLIVETPKSIIKQ